MRVVPYVHKVISCKDCPYCRKRDSGSYYCDHLENFLCDISKIDEGCEQEEAQEIITIS